jgi:hypothetical protein
MFIYTNIYRLNKKTRTYHIYIYIYIAWSMESGEYIPDKYTYICICIYTYIYILSICFLYDLYIFVSINVWICTYKHVLDINIHIYSLVYGKWRTYA